MSRIAKYRKVCAEFQHKVFSPENCEKEYVTMNVDELEALRLCDYENMDQLNAANKMGVSRGTFQRILYSARQKSAEALCYGKGICIKGGNYEIEPECNCDFPCKRCMRTT
jgi:uncharacterized protein